MKTILYARNACPNPEGIRKQLEQLEKYAADFGFTDCEQIIDDGFSGAGDAMDRPGFAHMMDVVDNEKVATVMVADLSQLSRNMGTALEIVDNLSESDVRVIALAESYDSMKAKYVPNEPFADVIG